MLRSRSLSPLIPHFILNFRVAGALGCAVLLLAAAGCSRSSRSPYRDWERIERDTWSKGEMEQEGIVSWYDECEFVATGERFNPEGMTAAHKTLPFGTIVRVTRLDTGESVVVEINDRGPFIEGRIIDLARGAAREINLLRKGIAPCRVEVLRFPTS